MNAGSSPDTGKSGVKGFVIPIAEPPVVEIDTEATAAYIRLRATAVARTEPLDQKKALSARLRCAGKRRGHRGRGPVGVPHPEAIKRVPTEVTDALLNQTRYVAADLQIA